MMGRPDLYLLCAANKTYALPLAVTLTSVVCNLKSGRPLHIHILSTDIDGVLREKIERSVTHNVPAGMSVTIDWHKVEYLRIAKYFHNVNVFHVSADTYSRFIADEYLPSACGNVVYMDCDTVALTDIAELSDALDHDMLLGAVSNVRHPYVSSSYSGRPVVFNFADMGIPPDSRYFQNGVLVINMPLWRSRGISIRLFDYLSRYHDDVILHDQGVFNAVLSDQWQRLDQRWNQVATVCHPEAWKEPAYTRDDWRKTKRQPFIVHYSGPDKPWNSNYRIPRGSFFLKYLKRTEFYGEISVPLAVRLEAVIGFPAFYILYRLKHFIKGRARSLKPSRFGN